MSVQYNTDADILVLPQHRPMRQPLSQPLSQPISRPLSYPLSQPSSRKWLPWALLLLGLLLISSPILYCWTHAAVADSSSGSLPIRGYPAIPGHLITCKCSI